MSSQRLGNKTRTDATAEPANETKGRKATSKAELVTKVIEKIEKKIDQDELKPTVGDLVRLLQLEKELEEDEQPTEVKVSWVESDDQEHAPEK